jgi:hypothetical protein
MMSWWLCEGWQDAAAGPCSPDRLISSDSCVMACAFHPAEPVSDDELAAACECEGIQAGSGPRLVRGSCLIMSLCAMSLWENPVGLLRRALLCVCAVDGILKILVVSHLHAIRGMRSLAHAC